MLASIAVFTETRCNLVRNHFWQRKQRSER